MSRLDVGTWDAMRGGFGLGLEALRLELAREEEARRTRQGDEELEFRRDRGLAADEQFDQELDLRRDRYAQDDEQFDQRHTLDEAQNTRQQAEFDREVAQRGALADWAVRSGVAMPERPQLPPGPWAHGYEPDGGAGTFGRMIGDPVAAGDPAAGGMGALAGMGGGGGMGGMDDAGAGGWGLTPEIARNMDPRLLVNHIVTQKQQQKREKEVAKLFAFAERLGPEWRNSPELREISERYGIDPDASMDEQTWQGDPLYGTLSPQEQMLTSMHVRQTGQPPTQQMMPSVGGGFAAQRQDQQRRTEAFLGRAEWKVKRAATDLDSARDDLAKLEGNPKLNEALDRDRVKFEAARKRVDAAERRYEEAEGEYDRTFDQAYAEPGQAPQQPQRGAAGQGTKVNASAVLSPAERANIIQRVKSRGGDAEMVRQALANALKSKTAGSAGGSR